MKTVCVATALAVVTGLAGCAGPGATPEELAAREEAKEETIQDILNTPLSAEDYSPGVSRCLSTHEYRSVDVIDNRRVLFRGAGDKLWLNELRHKCIGLRPDELLRFEMRSNRVCDLDTFEALDRGLGFMRASSTCTLGSFQPVTPEQVDAIELAVKESKGRRSGDSGR